MAYTPISTTPTSKTGFNYILDGEAANQNVANRPVNELVNYVFDTHVGSTGASHGVATQSANGFMSSADKTAFDNLVSFKTIAVSGQTDVVADSKTDTLTLVAGTNVSITTNTTSDSITISANDISVAWGEITSKPTTLSGYGITDAASSTHTHSSFNNDISVTGNATVTGNINCSLVDADIIEGFESIEGVVKTTPTTYVELIQASNLSGVYVVSGSVTLEANVNQALVIDGVSANLDDYVLLTSQTTQLQNGVYKVTNKGSATTKWVLTKDVYSYIKGVVISSVSGSSNKHKFYVNTNTVAISEGTSITYELMSTNKYLKYANLEIPWSSIINEPTFSVSTHSHGNISSDGKIGTAASLPVITTTGGALTTGSFGTTSGTFCQGNDSRFNVATTTSNGVMSSVDKIKIDRFSIYTTTTTDITQKTLTVGNKNISGTLKLIIQATTGSNRQSSEVLITHDGTTVSYTEYAKIVTNLALGVFDFTISSNDINILITSASATSTVYKILATSIDI